MPSCDLALHTDFYQLTMAAAYFDQGLEGTAHFSLFAHDLPPNRGYLVAAGLEEALDFLEGFCFSDEELDYLASLRRFRPQFLDYLRGLWFAGEVWALPEGCVFFGGEPVLEIRAPIIQAQLVETFIINCLNLHTMLASKAARCVQAAAGRSCVDFSLRRTQGREAGLAVARSSAIAGFSGTSNVAAARRYGLNPVGTMAHAFVEAFGDEITAFQAFAETFPDHTVMLVDTYDSPTGMDRAVAVAGELARKGHKLVGVRLDSGDLVAMSRMARAKLDAAGLTEAMVVVSGSLDEYRIAELVGQGAAVEAFGIGTKMGCSADAPYIDFAYKLVEYDGRPTLKLSTGKVTWVAPKQLWRVLDDQGRIDHDVMGLRGEDLAGQPLLEPVMANGRRLGERVTWSQARERCVRELATLPHGALEFASPTRPPLEVSPGLAELQESTLAELRLGKGD